MHFAALCWADCRLFCCDAVRGYCCGYRSLVCAFDSWCVQKKKAHEQTKKVTKSNKREKKNSPRICPEKTFSRRQLRAEDGATTRTVRPLASQHVFKANEVKTPTREGEVVPAPSTTYVVRSSKRAHGDGESIISYS